MKHKKQRLNESEFIASDFVASFALHFIPLRIDTGWDLFFLVFFFVFQIEIMCHAFTYLHLLGFYAPCVNFQSVWKYSVVTLYAMFYLSTLCYNFSRCIFAATMSMKHFQLISAFLEFDVRKTREERWKHDKFACMSYIFDKVNCKFAEVSYFYV